MNISEELREFKDQLKRHLNKQNLTELEAQRSIVRSMKEEEQAIEDENDDVRQILHGRERNRSTDDEMRDFTAGGDVYFGVEPSDKAKKDDAPQAPPPQVVQKPPMSRPLAWGLGTAATLGALTLPILAWNMSRQPTPEQETVNLGARFVPVPPELQD